MLGSSRVVMDPLHELHSSRQSIMCVNRQRDSISPRRHRSTLSCTSCRRRKVKCDRLTPCGHCLRHNMADLCRYAPKPTKGRGRQVSTPASPPAGPPLGTKGSGDVARLCDQILWAKSLGVNDGHGKANITLSTLHGG